MYSCMRSERALDTQASLKKKTCLDTKSVSILWDFEKRALARGKFTSAAAAAAASFFFDWTRSAKIITANSRWHRWVRRKGCFYMHFDTVWPNKCVRSDPWMEFVALHPPVRSLSCISRTRLHVFAVQELLLWLDNSQPSLSDRRCTASLMRHCNIHLSNTLPFLLWLPVAPSPGHNFSPSPQVKADWYESPELRQQTC